MLSKKINYKKIILLAEIAIILSIITAFCLMYLVSFQMVTGDSMQPSLADKDVVAVNIRAKNFSAGDTIVFKTKDGNMIKRVIAVPGDTIKIENNAVFVNGKQLSEDYLLKTARTKIAPAEGIDYLLSEGQELKIDENQYFVLGDKRENSLDSRFVEIGLIDNADIIGKATMQVWPLGNFKLIERGTITYSE